MMVLRPCGFSNFSREWTSDVVLPGGLTGAQVAAEASGSAKFESSFHDGMCAQCHLHHRRLDKGVQLIVKPFGFSDLAAKVRDILDGSRD
jgi:hypothetical protein